jgi:hypothetical protein
VAFSFVSSYAKAHSGWVPGSRAAAVDRSNTYVKEKKKSTTGGLHLATATASLSFLLLRFRASATVGESVAAPLRRLWRRKVPRYEIAPRGQRSGGVEGAGRRARPQTLINK